MKAALLIFAALIAYICAAPSPCCTPDQWTGDVLEWDDELDFFVVRHFTYDARLNRLRADNEIHHTRTFKNTEILFYNNRVAYRIEAGVCRKLTLSGNFQRICLPSNSTYEATVSIGNSLATDLFNFRDRARGVYLDDLVTSAECLPVTSMLITPRVRHEYSEVWNVVTSVDPTSFQIPDICNPNDPPIGVYPLSQKMKWYYIHSHL